MRQPLAALPLVDAEPLQALVEIDRQTRCPAALVLANEHADAPCLAIALDLERRGRGSAGGRSQLGGNRLELPHGPVAQEGERDVELLGAEHADPVGTPECVGLPAPERLDRPAGQEQGAEQAQAFTATDSS